MFGLFGCVCACVGVVYLYMEYTYPSWTGPIALPALDSSAINARVIDSVAPRPPSCYKYMLKIEKKKQNVLEVDIENSREHTALRTRFLASSVQFSNFFGHLYIHPLSFRTRNHSQKCIIAKQTHTSKGSWNECRLI